MSYDPELTDPISRVRFAVGDTGTPELLPDDTYTAVLTANSNDEVAAARAIAQALIARYAHQATRVTTVSGQTVEYKDRLAAWQQLVNDTTPAGTTVSGFQSHRPRRSDRHTRGAEYYRGDPCDW